MKFAPHEQAAPMSADERGAVTPAPIGGANYLVELVAYGKSRGLDFVKANIHELDAIQTELIDAMQRKRVALRCFYHSRARSVA